jgi:hypothetical protein
VNFSSFGGSGDVNLCGYAGCMDESAENTDYTAVEDDGSCEYAGCTDPTAVNYNSDVNIDDDSCGYSGCNDPTAGNYVENGENYYGQLYDCSGNAGIFDMSCCQFMGCNVAEATNYVSAGSDCSGVPDGIDDSCCTFSPTDISTFFSVAEETFDSNNYSTSSVELSWNESTSCAGGTEWSYVICLENVAECDTTNLNSIVYDIGWSSSIDYSLFAFGCAIDIYDELYGTEIAGTMTSNERPFPTIPSTPIVVDNSGEGFVELEWDESYQADYYSIVFRNILNAEDEIEFTASDDSTDIILNYGIGNVSAIFYPLGAGKTYQAQVSARNLNSLSEEQSSSYSTFSENIAVIDFPEAPENGFMFADSISFPYSVELTWQAAPDYGTYAQDWTYEVVQTGVGAVFSPKQQR